MVVAHSLGLPSEWSMDYVPPSTSETLLLTLDLVGTFVFAISGAAFGGEKPARCVRGERPRVRGGQRRGIDPDLLIGAVPPAATSDWRYAAVSLVARIIPRPPERGTR